jgi:ubiquinone/menaquinone biosynthesis C-methylase UbiE
MKTKKDIGYEKEYHELKHEHLYSNKYYYLIRSKLALLKYFKGIKNEKVLEFGCGLGQNIFLIKNSVGYDVSDFAVNFCKNKGIIATKNLDELKDNSFDIVFSCHVLEHLENPQESIKLMTKKLKKGGKLIIIIPVEKTRKHSLKIDENQHVYCWTFQTINNLLIKSGLKPIENKYFRGSGYKKLLLFSRINLKLYIFLTRIVAFLKGSKEMKIVAIKE